MAVTLGLFIQITQQSSTLSPQAAALGPQQNAVSAPTSAMTGATADVNAHPSESSSELHELFVSSGGTEVQAKTISEALKNECRIEKTETFYKHFENFSHGKWVEDMADKVTEWKRDGPLFCTIDNAFESSKRLWTAKEKAENTVLDDVEDNTPLDAETNRSLTTAWRKAYGYSLHPTQEYTSQLPRYSLHPSRGH